MLKKAIIVVAIFLATGELFVRLDRMAGFFQADHTVEVGSGLRRSAELASVEAGTFLAATDETRIILVGDSALHGSGLPVDEIFAERLKSLAATDPAAARRPFRVLDLTVAGANARVLREKYFEFADRFAPTVVLIAYNNNDVYGEIAPSNPGTQPKQRNFAPKRVHSLRRLLSFSRLLEFVLVNLNMQLKIHGIVLPGSEFDHLVRKAYAPGSEGWKLARDHMDAIIQDAARRGAEVVVYNVPQLNMLDNYGVFANVDATIAAYFQGHHPLFIEGVTPFRDKDRHAYALSKYDGHPNGAATAIIARHVWEAIRAKHLAGR